MRHWQQSYQCAMLQEPQDLTLICQAPGEDTYMGYRKHKTRGGGSLKLVYGSWLNKKKKKQIEETNGTETKVTYLSMQIFSTCGTKTCNRRMIVWRGSLAFQLSTQAVVGVQGWVAQVLMVEGAAEVWLMLRPEESDTPD